MNHSARLMLFALALMLALTTLVWAAALREDRRGDLTVSFLDVGQGDAILIDAPSGRQALVDGGPDSSVLRRLAESMSWYDRTIDLVLATHPDADHIGGLVDVLSRYRVGTIAQSSVQGSTDLWRSFEREASSSGARIVYAQRGQVFDLGGGARLEILFPDRAVPHVETNVGCVVAKLSYGQTSFMLPCDTTKDVEEYLVRLDGEGLRADVLKAAHHGSKTSSSLPFVAAVDPAFAVFSRGCKNRYGHPNKETIDTFARFGIAADDTCAAGSITFVSDGQTVARR